MLYIFQFLIINVNEIIIEVELNRFVTVLSSAIINYNQHKMITTGHAKDLVVISWYSVEEYWSMSYNKIQVLRSYILCLICCLVYSTCLGYTAFLAGEIYAQSIQSGQNSVH